MNILFIVGCLEAGKDGVGDYTRRLAEQYSAKGVSCFVVALYDPYVRQAEILSQDNLVLFRLPHHVPFHHKIDQCKKNLGNISFDWISLQYVSYAFDKRGLNSSLPHFISQMKGPGTQVHIMFHELWIGEDMGAPWQKKILGHLQRFLIKRMVRKCQPRKIHTSIPIFKQLLKNNEIEANLLPLFSNIPINKTPDFTWISSKLEKESVAREHTFIVCMFGSIIPDWDPTLCSKTLNEISNRSGKTILLLSVGKIGAGNGLWEKMKQTHLDWKFVLLGEQPPERISDVLHFADCGLSSVPSHIIGKSGAFAAMREHGLPVLCTPTTLSYNFQVQHEESYDRVNLCGSFDPISLLTLPKGKIQDLMAQVETQFRSDLSLT